MSRMTVLLALVIGMVAGAGVLGVATGETTTTATQPVTMAPREVTVQGVASEAISQHADLQSANGIYRQGMTDALADAQSKAGLLSSKAGAGLGVVQSISEGGGEIQCTDETEYEGQQPDFGYPREPTRSPLLGAPVLSSQKTKAHKRKSRKPKHAKARKASAGTCALSAELVVVYLLS